MKTREGPPAVDYTLTQASTLVNMLAFRLALFEERMNTTNSLLQTQITKLQELPERMSETNSLLQRQITKLKEVPQKHTQDLHQMKLRNQELELRVGVLSQQAASCQELEQKVRALSQQVASKQYLEEQVQSLSTKLASNKCPCGKIEGDHTSNVLVQCNGCNQWWNQECESHIRGLAPRALDKFKFESCDNCVKKE